MLKIVDAQTMAAIDQEAVSAFNVTGLALMEQAGRELAALTQKWVSQEQDPLILILAGGGKNGGDGLVSARHLAQAGLRVEVVLLAGSRLATETRENMERLTAQGVPIIPWEDGDTATRRLEQADLVIDALLGIGLQGPPRPPQAEAIQALNRLKTTVLAADVPSGLDANTGQALEPTVRADCTLTFGLPKIGLLHPRAADRVGQLFVKTIGFPRALLSADKEEVHYFDDRDAALCLPRRPVDAHKRSAGKVLVIGGPAQYHGALLLAGSGARHGGAGFVRLAYPKQLDTVVRCQTREALCSPLPAGPTGALGAAALALLLELAKEQDAVVIGPGLGLAESTLKLVREFLQRLEGPRAVVVDADALPGLVLEPGSSRPARIPGIILTPHEGEAGRLLRQPTEKIQEDRWAATRELSRRSGGTVVLKGRHTAVQAPGQALRVIGAGTQALASAGSGDVLAGLIAALSAQALEPFDAAAVGAYALGVAGSLASPDPWGLGVQAGDISRALPRAYGWLRGITKKS